MVTAGVANLMGESIGFERFCIRSLVRHTKGDWGDLCEEDRRENESSLERGFRLMSVYKSEHLPTIWIITEADRSVTTILFPEEY